VIIAGEDSKKIAAKKKGTVKRLLQHCVTRAKSNPMS
jgi:hypothetical protein